MSNLGGYEEWVDNRERSQGVGRYARGVERRSRPASGASRGFRYTVTHRIVGAIAIGLMGLGSGVPAAVIVGAVAGFFMREVLVAGFLAVVAYAVYLGIG